MTALASAGDTVLVASAGRDGPRVDWLRAGVATRLPVTTSTGYGREASVAWLADGPAGQLAVGGVRGGAHGNTRWSVFTADGGGLAEREQPFETFGGWEAGTIVGAASADTPVVAGSWRGSIGLDITLWTPTGRRPSRAAMPAWSADEPRMARSLPGG